MVSMPLTDDEREKSICFVGKRGKGRGEKGCGLSNEPVGWWLRWNRMKLGNDGCGRETDWACRDTTLTTDQFTDRPTDRLQ